MSRPDHFPDCMALSSKREACLGYRETRTKLDLEEKENERLRAALRSITLLGAKKDLPDAWVIAHEALSDGDNQQSSKPENP